MRPPRAKVYHTNHKQRLVSLIGMMLLSIGAASAFAIPPGKTTGSTKNLLHIEKQSIGNAINPQLKNAYQVYQSGDFAGAQQAYLEILANEAGNCEALLGLAAIAQQHEEPLLATHYYLRVLKIHPHDPTAHAALAALNNTDDNTENRLTWLLKEQPDSAPLNFALGNHYATQSRWDEAQQVYFHAHSLTNDNPQFALNLAISLDHLGQEKPALQYYRQALQLDTRHRLDDAAITQRIRQLSL